MANEGIIEQVNANIRMTKYRLKVVAPQKPGLNMVGMTEFTRFVRGGRNIPDRQAGASICSEAPYKCVGN
jgi:hypothetical protein